MAVGEDYYYSSDDSDDDDVDRYVFLARQPQPPRSHAEEEASDEDDDDDETEDERVEDGGRRGMKRPLRAEAVSSDASPSLKKARLGMIIAPPPLASHKTRTSSSTEDQMVSSSPRGGVRDRESSGSAETREDDERSDPRRGKAKDTTTKLVVGLCGKRNSLGREEVDQEQRRDVTKAAKTSPYSARRFPCSLCDRCFASYQALGGHVLGHQKKARIAATALAAASLHDAGGRGNCREEIVVAVEVELDHDDANGTGHVKQKTYVDKKSVHDIDRDGHMKPKPKKKKPYVVAEEHHMGAHGDGETDMRASVFTASLAGVNGHDGNKGKASSRSSHTGHNDADVKNKKGDVNGTSNVTDACRAQHYKCKVCGIECPTGRALGGHMRKHRKQPAQGADGDGRPVADGDSMIPLSRQFGVTGSQRALGIAGETSR
jgi:hypothetical protein